MVGTQVICPDWRINQVGEVVGRAGIGELDSGESLAVRRKGHVARTESLDALPGVVVASTVILTMGEHYARDGIVVKTNRTDGTHDDHEGGTGEMGLSAGEMMLALREKRLELKGRIERMGLTDREVSELTGGRLSVTQVWHLRTKCYLGADLCDALEEALKAAER